MLEKIIHKKLQLTNRTVNMSPLDKSRCYLI